MRFEIIDIIILFLFILCIGFTLLMIIPRSEELNYLITTSIMGSPILIPYSDKQILANNFLDMLNYMQENTAKIPSEITSMIVPLVPNSIVTEITKGIPNNLIDESKCLKPIKDTKFKGEPIPIPDDLPWDEKVDYCKSRHGTLDDIEIDDFKQRTLDSDARIIIY